MSAPCVPPHNCDFGTSMDMDAFPEDTSAFSVDTNPDAEPAGMGGLFHLFEGGKLYQTPLANCSC